MSEPTANDMMEAYALDAVDFGKKFNEDLDFSRESIEKVERICTILFNAIPKNFFTKLIRRNPSEEQKLQISKALGGYVGEVMRKNFGGNWSIEKLFDQENTLALTIGKMKLSPVARVYRRLTNGPEDNVWHYFQVLESELKS